MLSDNGASEINLSSLDHSHLSAVPNPKHSRFQKQKSNDSSKFVGTHQEYSESCSPNKGKSTTPARKRKERSDKNKRRKHPNRAYNTSTNNKNEELNLLVGTKLKQAPDSDIEKLLPYDPSKNYFREFYRLYLENENLLTDIDLTSSENYKMERRVLNILDFYDSTLIPSIATQPHKFIHRK